MEAFTATIQMALFISLPDKPYFTCIGLALAKLYSNSLLAILNSRIRIEGVHTNSTAQMTAGSSLAFYGQSAASRRTALPYASAIRKDDNNGPHIVDVRIQHHTETWTAADDMIPMDDTVSSYSVIMMMNIYLPSTHLEI